MVRKLLFVFSSNSVHLGSLNAQLLGSWPSSQATPEALIPLVVVIVVVGEEYVGAGVVVVHCWPPQLTPSLYL